MENNPSSTSKTAWHTGRDATGAQPADQGRQPIEQVKQQAQQAVQQIPQKAGELADRAREQVKSQVATQKERAAGSLESVAQAIRQTGDNLEQSDQGALAQYADTLAGQVERFSGYLREQDIDQLLGEVQGFARRQPALFLGTAFTLGFMAARFLKSSRPDRDWNGGRYGTASLRTTDVAYEPATALRADLYPTDTSTAVTTTPMATTVVPPAYGPAPGGE